MVAALVARAGVPVSIDTTKAVVAEAALAAGAAVVNDVWALRRDPTLASAIVLDLRVVALERGAGGAAVGLALEGYVARAEAAGIPRDRLIVDPGIGFGKTVARNLAVLRRLGELKARPGLRGLPLLLGTARKSVIGLTLDLPVEERLAGTLATLALGLAQGVNIVRVHDVRAAVRCCRMADAIVRDRVADV